MHRLAAALLLASLFPVTALAEARASFSDEGRTLFSFTVPAFWTLNAGGPRMLTLPETGEARAVPQILSIRPQLEPTVWMAFYSPTGVRNLAEGGEYLQEIGQFLAATPQVTDSTTRRIGGRPAQVIRGTGRRNGRALQFSIAIIDLPGPRVAIGASVAEAGTDPAFYDEMNRVFSSFRVGP